MLLLDAADGITEQDAHLAGHILEAGRALVVGINKWDAADTEQRAQVKRDLERKLRSSPSPSSTTSRRATAAASTRCCARSTTPTRRRWRSCRRRA